MIPPTSVIFLKDSRETSPSREIYHHSLVPDINLVCYRKRNAEKITSFDDRERAFAQGTERCANLSGLTGAIDNESGIELRRILASSNDTRLDNQVSRLGDN